MQASPEQQICSLPRQLTFEYHQGQRMYTTLTIVNLIDQVVAYNIKTNKPTLYIVKPMEGQIYNYSNVKIQFNRQEMLRDQYEAYGDVAANKKQRFLIEFICTSSDAIGRQKTYTQQEYIMVQMKGNKKRGILRDSDLPLDFNKFRRMANLSGKNFLEESRQQLLRLEKIRQTEIGRQSRLHTLALDQIILLMILAFMVGATF